MSERHPATVGAAWDCLLTALQDESVCYRAGGQRDGDFRPLRQDGVNCGLAVYEAVERLQESGRWTREQILAVTQLCKWVARAARN